MPRYKGATLRGGFGHAFRRVACITHQKSCENCMMRPQCVYATIFDTPTPPDTPMFRAYPYVPHPFVICPPLDTTTQYTADDTIIFRVTLIGNAEKYLPYFVYSFIQLGKSGLGRERGKFTLEQVTTASSEHNVTVYHKDSETFSDEYATITAPGLTRRIKDIANTETLTMRFQTPTRIKHQQLYTTQPDFRTMIAALLRRLSIIHHLHCSGIFPEDVNPLLAQAETINITHDTRRWQDWSRYSMRQQTRMSLGGFVGDITVTGDLAPFAETLAWGELTHIGKATSFGLGRMQLDLY